VDWIDYVFHTPQLVAKEMSPTTICGQMPSEQHPSDHLPLAVCFDFFIASRSKDDVVAVDSEDRLRQVLSQAGVDTEGWGINGKKSLSDLLVELKQKDCFLSMVDGKLIRVLGYVEVEVQNAEGNVLVETEQTLQSGHVRQVHNLLTGKMRAGEVWQLAVGRSASEKLKLPFSGDTPIAILSETLTTSIEEKTAFSYPNLRCQYRKHQVKAELNVELLPASSPLHNERFSTAGAGADSTVVQHHWVWESREERSFTNFSAEFWSCKCPF